MEYLYNTSDNHRAIAEALQSMWKDVLGVTVNISNEEWGTFLQTRKNGRSQIARNVWIADFNDPISFIDMWQTGGGNNDAQYSNPAYDALVNKAKASLTAEDRMTAMHEAEDILMGEYVLGPIYYYVQPYMVQGIADWYYTPLGYFIFSYASPAK